MGRRYTIADHPKRAEIEKALAAGDRSLRNIAEQYNISHVSLHRYLHERFAEKAAKARELQDAKEGDRIYHEIRAVMERCQKLYDAADEWLTDPENPEKYYIGPRADEVVVYYEEKQGEAVVRRSATLQELLNNVGREVVSHRTKYADPRELLLKTAQTLNRQLELIAEVLGKIQTPSSGGDTFIAMLMELHEHKHGD